MDTSKVISFNEPKSWERSLTELTKKERKVILSIRKPQDIKSCKVIDTWTDDHLECVGVKLNGVDIGFWWTESGPFSYWKSRQAKLDIIEQIDGLVDVADWANDDCPEGLTKEELLLWGRKSEKDIDAGFAELAKNDAEYKATMAKQNACKHKNTQVTNCTFAGMATMVGKKCKFLPFKKMTCLDCGKTAVEKTLVLAKRTLKLKSDF